MCCDGASLRAGGFVVVVVEQRKGAGTVLGYIGYLGWFVFALVGGPRLRRWLVPERSTPAGEGVSQERQRRVSRRRPRRRCGRVMVTRLR
jgi:hypothetical protein